MRTAILTLAVLAIAAPALSKNKGETIATLRDTSGNPLGSASAMQHGKQLMIGVIATGMPPGTHGVHVHMTGKCLPPKFESAGAHWNPTMKKHGRDNPAGAHHGDLPNLEIAADGAGRLSFMVPAGSLKGKNGLMDTDGAAIVVHAKADDYKTDPSGNSGDRIACGVFMAK